MILAKKDSSVHKICVASIKRHTMKPYDFRWTKFYETKFEFEDSSNGLILNLEEDELPICSTIIDQENWSILTTRRLITNEKKLIIEKKIGNAKIKSIGDFKGLDNQQLTFGEVQFEDGNEMKYYIETGEASMVMIYGVKTRIGILPKSIEAN